MKRFILVTLAALVLTACEKPTEPPQVTSLTPPQLNVGASINATFEVGDPVVIDDPALGNSLHAHSPCPTHLRPSPICHKPGLV